MNIPLDEVLYFDAITSTPSTGAAVDADSTPTFVVMEESTDTDIGVGGNMTKRTSLTGNYRGTFTLSAANGFEVGKWYSVVVSAVVGGVTGKAVVKNFRVVAAEATAGKTPATIATGDSVDATTLLARIGAFTGSGVNTVLGFLKAVMSKTASTPSDVGGTFDATTDSTEAIRDRGDAAWVTGSGSGTGAYPITVTVNDGSTALQNAIVRVTEGSNTFTVTTNASGQGSFSLDAATYTVTVTKAGYSFTPTTRTVTGSQAGTLVNALSMTVVTITPASDPSETNAYLTTRDAHGDVLAAVSLEFRLISTASAAAGASYPTTWMTATSNGSGLLTIALLRLAKYEGRRNVTGRYGRPVQFTTTDTSTYQLPEVLGANDAE